MATATTNKGSRRVKATAEGTAKRETRDAMKMSLAQLQKHDPKTDPRLLYSENITEAAKRTKALSGSNQAPGAKQVLMVVKALGGEDPVAASGMTLAQLKKYAAGDMARDEARRLRKGGMVQLEAKVANSFTKSRHMAGVLLALHEGSTKSAAKTARSRKAQEKKETAAQAEQAEQAETVAEQS